MAEALLRISIRNMPRDLWQRVRVLAVKRGVAVHKIICRGAGALLENRGKMSEWQTIETAPKDGTIVLVYEGYYKSGNLIHTAQYLSRQWVVLDGMEGNFML